MSLILVNPEKGLSLQLDTESVEYLPEAIELFEKVARHQGGSAPAGLQDARLFVLDAGEGDKRQHQAASANSCADGAPEHAEVASDDRKLLLQKEAAALLGVHPVTVSRWIAEGRLLASGLGRNRVSRAEVDRHLAARKDGAR